MVEFEHLLVEWEAEISALEAALERLSTRPLTAATVLSRQQVDEQLQAAKAAKALLEDLLRSA